MTTNLELFYNAVMEAQSKPITKIYTYSKRAKIALNVLNECADEHPEWLNTIQMISIHPVQTWAREMRMALSLSLENIVTALNTGDLYLGFENRSLLNQQKRVLEVTDEAMDLMHEVLIENSLELPGPEIEALRALHTASQSEVSNFIFHKYYKTALEHLCEGISDEVNVILEPIQAELMDMEEELKVAYHSAYLLVQMGKTLSREEHKRSSLADFEVLYDQIMRCIESLKTYPFNGEDMYQITSMVFQGYREVRIAKELNKSRTYVRAKFRDGTNALGMLIWGYATPAIVGLE